MGIDIRLHDPELDRALVAEKDAEIERLKLRLADQKRRIIEAVKVMQVDLGSSLYSDVIAAIKGGRVSTKSMGKIMNIQEE